MGTECQKEPEGLELLVDVTEALGVFVVPSLAYAFAFFRNHGKNIVAAAFVFNCLLLASAIFYDSLTNYYFNQNPFSDAGASADSLQSAFLILVLLLSC